MKKGIYATLIIAIIAVVLLSGCTDTVCGDGVCEGSEDSFNCEEDCGPPIICGNGSCERGEDANNCPADCYPSGYLSVTVTNSETGMPIQGAYVLVTNIYSEPKAEGTTDANGIALIRDLKPERYLVTISKTGYITSEKNPIITPPGYQTAEMRIELVPLEQPTTGNLEITVLDMNSTWPVEGIRVDLNKGGFGGLALATSVLVKSISVEPTTARGIVAVQVDGTTAQYNEGDQITGLTGAGAFSGQEMTVKIAAVIQTSPTISYQARFELYDQYGNQVDSQIAGTGARLNQLFIGTGSQEEIFTEGDDVTGLKGTGGYEEQDMTVKIAAITQPGGTANYQARFELYDQYGNQVDSQTAGTDSYLNRNFVSRDGHLVLATQVYVYKIYIEPPTSRGVVELRITRSEETDSGGKALFKGLTPGVYTATVPPNYTSDGPETVTVYAGQTTEAIIYIV
ncbi:MAG: carboxypeptidase regulatory-like domain-containing protein [Candidatus Diapherotrites archaeon]|uniref:Carboxypeptidase regulatory-like domain-containing protein n=1 Tax=Candidatus Iainarchaeum sp. TaxID=3101447 RepID=A0A939C8Z6_9ARCH|nr:carboxypeptidase regulatory-like domain-containing protein [Candidatus Diapherotrites archaeon]